MHIAVIGAGHAGVEAARAAAEAGQRVTLFSAELVLPYFRPRLVAYAFGQAEAAALAMHPADWYARLGIELRLGARAAALDPGRCAVECGGRTERFDAVVLAVGARPAVPPFDGAPHPAVLPLWDWEHAEAIRARVRGGGRIAVVGGGILGIEAALRARDAGMQVLVIECLPRLMPAQFGQRASAVLERRLRERGVDVALGRRVVSVSPPAQDAASLRLDDGRTFAADLCLVSAGARPDIALPRQCGLAFDRGLVVDTHLRTSPPWCFAAGDVIQYEGVTRCSAREAAGQGRVAGRNAAAALAGLTLEAYRPETQPLTFRSGDFELYAVGQPCGTGCEEHLLQGATERILRALVTRDGIAVGVQMIGTREDFDRCAEMVKRAARAPHPAVQAKEGK